MRIVLTGGPGSGKTKVLNALSERGYSVGEDAARTIIKERKAAGLSPRPEAKEFAEQILEREIAAYQTEGSPMFFERGIVDVAGSLYGLGEENEQRAMRLIETYPYDHVFLFPAWEAIYQTDDERDHTFEHAVRVHESTRAWYERVGYEVVEVPIASADERAEFILNAVKSH